MKVEEISNHPKPVDIAWDDGVIVYGIVGVLELISGALLHFNRLFTWSINQPSRP